MLLIVILLNYFGKSNFVKFLKTFLKMNCQNLIIKINLKKKKHFKFGFVIIVDNIFLNLLKINLKTKPNPRFLYL